MYQLLKLITYCYTYYLTYFDISLLIITYNCVEKFIIVKIVISNITSKHIFKSVCLAWRRSGFDPRSGQT